MVTMKHQRRKTDFYFSSNLFFRKINKIIQNKKPEGKKLNKCFEKKNRKKTIRANGPTFFNNTEALTTRRTEPKSEVFEIKSKPKSKHKTERRKQCGLRRDCFLVIQACVLR